MNGVRTGVSFRTVEREGSYDFSCFSAPKPVLFPDRLEDMLYVKIRFALDNENVTAIHGIFVHRTVGMFDYIEQYWDELLGDIRNGTVNDCFQIREEWKEYLRQTLKPNPARADQLAALDRSTLKDGMLRKIWKNLRYLRLCNGPQFRPYYERLAELAGDIPIHGYIYASSESFFGIAPRINAMCKYALIPDVCYYEFIPEEQIEEPKDFLTIEDIKQGSRYELIITTLSGLYRYRIGDIVEIIGFLGETPLIRICYRKDMVISLLDEKMDTIQIEQSVRLFMEKTGIQVNNYCVTGKIDDSMPRYIVYLETDQKLPPDAAAVMDQYLCDNSFGYNGIREMNELTMPEVYRVRVGAFNDYQKYRQEKKMRMEQSKLVRVLLHEDQVAFFDAERVPENE